jgi:uracil-DNA glycosylase family protein
LTSAKRAAGDCRACDLYARATQTVFGEGPRRAEVMMVGEAPGDQEDLAGHPFVGPAGRLLDRALERAKIERRLVYLTNVVKHFKWEPRGKRRIHAKPNAAEVAACRPWLDVELSLVKPRRRSSAARSRCRPSADVSSNRRSRRSCWHPFTRHRFCGRGTTPAGGGRWISSWRT